MHTAERANTRFYGSCVATNEKFMFSSSAQSDFYIAEEFTAVLKDV
jgi:hypothetical protein